MGIHFPLNTAQGRGSSHWNNTPVVNATVQDIMTAYRIVTAVLCVEVQASRSKNVVIESFESPIVMTYRIVVAYSSFCISSRAAGVSMDILLPKPDSTANDPAIVPPIAINWIMFSLLQIIPC